MSGTNGHLLEAAMGGPSAAASNHGIAVGLRYEPPHTKMESGVSPAHGQDSQGEVRVSHQSSNAEIKAFLATSRYISSSNVKEAQPAANG